MSTNEPKWTPGPWAFDPINTELVIQENSDPYTYVAEIWYDEPELDGVSYEEREANANLIAPAPDLYKALDQLVSRFVGHEDDREIVEARAALSKALGE